MVAIRRTFFLSNRERNHEYDNFDKVIEYEYDYFVFLTNVIEYEYDSSKMAYDYTRVRFPSTIIPGAHSFCCNSI